MTVEANPSERAIAALEGGSKFGVTLVVPCFNEAERLDFVQFDEYLDAHPDARVIFVDDASTDATRQVLQEYCAGRESCSMISLERNRGKAEAVRQGMMAAFGSGVALAGYWDADLATPLRCVDELTAVFESYPDVKAVLGSRIRILGLDIQRKTSRHYLGRVFATVVSLLLGVPVYDTQCGAKLFRNDRSVKEAFETPFASRWIFDVEILGRLMRWKGVDRSNFGVFVREQPLSSWKDVSGSKLKLTNFFQAAIDLARMWRRGLR